MKKMNCYFHEEKVSVGKCDDCGKFLCKQCASKYEPYVLCTPCATKRQKNYKARMEKSEKELKKYCGISLAVNVIFIVIGLFFVNYALSENDEWQTIIVGFLAFMSFPTVFSLWEKLKDMLKSNSVEVIVNFLDTESLVLEMVWGLFKIMLAMIVAVFAGVIVSPIVIITIVQKVKVLMGKDIKFEKIFKYFV